MSRRKGRSFYTTPLYLSIKKDVELSPSNLSQRQQKVLLDLLTKVLVEVNNLHRDSLRIHTEVKYPAAFSWCGLERVNAEHGLTSVNLEDVFSSLNYRRPLPEAVLSRLT